MENLVGFFYTILMIMGAGFLMSGFYFAIQYLCSSKDEN